MTHCRCRALPVPLIRWHRSFRSFLAADQEAHGDCQSLVHPSITSMEYFFAPGTLTAGGSGFHQPDNVALRSGQPKLRHGVLQDGATHTLDHFMLKEKSVPPFALGHISHHVFLQSLQQDVRNSEYPEEACSESFAAWRLLLRDVQCALPASTPFTTSSIDSRGYITVQWNLTTMSHSL